MISSVNVYKFESLNFHWWNFWISIGFFAFCSSLWLSRANFRAPRFEIIIEIAAAAKFADDYGNKYIILHAFHFDRTYRTAEVLKNGDIIEVNGLKYCLTVLRCFGAKFLHSHLILNWTIYAKTRNSYVERYVNQYCADTLGMVSYNNK